MSYPNHNPQQGYYGQPNINPQGIRNNAPTGQTFNPQQLLQGHGQGYPQIPTNLSLPPQQPFQLSQPPHQRQTSAQRMQPGTTPTVIPPSLVHQLQNRLPPQQAQALQQLLQANPGLQQQLPQHSRPSSSHSQSSSFGFVQPAQAQQQFSNVRGVPSQAARSNTPQPNSSPLIQPPALYPTQPNPSLAGSSRPTTPASTILTPSQQQTPQQQRRPSNPSGQPTSNPQSAGTANGQPNTPVRPQPRPMGPMPINPTFRNVNPTLSRLPVVASREARIGAPESVMSQVQFTLPPSQPVRSPVTGNAPSHPPIVEVRRHKKDMTLARGQLRGDVSKLMSASGDVQEPNVDTVDYMEDLVVEFLSDLCRPVQPIRPTPTSAYQPIPLTSNILRHRLASAPVLRKYLDRFDTMTHLTTEIAAQRRLAASTETPHDLVAAVGKEFLGYDDPGESAEGGRKKGVKRGRGEVGTPGGGGGNEDGGAAGERRKPGPRKGFKKGGGAGVGGNVEGEGDGGVAGGAVKAKRVYRKRPRVGSSVPRGSGTPTPSRV